MKISELAELLFVGISNMLYNLALSIYETLRYGRHIWWWALKFEYLKRYGIRGAFSIVKKERAAREYPEDNFIYGETPAVTVERIIRTAGAKKGDLFIDLGSGRGLAVFYAHYLAGLKAHGYELLPTFHRHASSIKNRLGTQGVKFFNEDLLKAGLDSAAIIYIAGTTFDDDFIEKLNQKLRPVKGNTVIVTLSYSLSKKYFRLFEEQELPFSWGKSHVYYHRRRERSLPVKKKETANPDE